MRENSLIIVVDDGFSLSRISESIHLKFDVVSIFPLTSDYLKIGQLKLNLLNKGHGEVIIENSAEKVALGVSSLKATMLPFLATLGDNLVGNIKLKEFLLINSLSVSAWWLGILSERSPLKSPAFLHIAQLIAFENTLRASRYDHCLIALDEIFLSQSLIIACKKAGVQTNSLRSTKKLKLIDEFKQLLRSSGVIGQLMMGILAWFRVCYKVFRAKRVLGSRLYDPQNHRGLLFVTYFPFFESEAAEKGKFQNKYTGPLQNNLIEIDRSPIWLLIFNKTNQINYAGALLEVKKFVSANEPLVLLEQCCLFIDLFRVLYYYIFVAIKSSLAYKFIAWRELEMIPMPESAEPIWRDLWLSSFLGSEGLSSIYFAVAFQRVAQHYAPRLDDCLYLWEMQPWEKSLCAAWKTNNGKRIIAVQHSSLPTNLWSCIITPHETIRTGQDSDLPLPDIVAANGNIPEQILAYSNYPNLIQVEAIRYIYLQGMHLKKQHKNEIPVLLVVGSINYQETIAMLRLVLAMDPIKTKIRIILKGHPSMPFGPLLEEINLPEHTPELEIYDGDLYGALDVAWVALVSASTVGLEALALGCKIIVPSFPDAIQLNPVSEYENLYVKISSPSQLSIELEKMITRGMPLTSEEAWNFINEYWNLNPELSFWKKLLMVTGGCCS